uniref:Uncharacterized protein n=1 Tax=Trichogramma kaykai TaxID=54128 RepID=A0ABD2W0G1_9HYME
MRGNAASSSSTFIYGQYTRCLNAAMPGYVLLYCTNAPRRNDCPISTRLVVCGARSLRDSNYFARMRQWRGHYDIFRLYCQSQCSDSAVPQLERKHTILYRSGAVYAMFAIRNFFSQDKTTTSRATENRSKFLSREYNVYGRLTAAATAAVVAAAAIHVQASSIACFSRKFKEHVHGEANGKKETRCIRPRTVSVAV